MKQFGVGLAVGVALAGMTVMLLAPALLVLVGERGTWWVPQWAQRVVPHIDIEGATMDRSGGSAQERKDPPAPPEDPPAPRKDSMQF
ncbi:MAG TPA: MMPL family transporter [Solirubrobacterales bacterium]|nr:MMPL family transporter [Solirubrobacterales bacterium]